jgi:hypothetical protein
MDKKPWISPYTKKAYDSTPCVYFYAVLPMQGAFVVLEFEAADGPEYGSLRSSHRTEASAERAARRYAAAWF